MAHYLAISGGRISFRSAMTDAKPVLFDSDEDAADAAAVAMMDTKVTQFLYSSSCFHPDDEGRPDFDLDVFFDLVEKKLNESGVETE